ncbi:GrpB family protein [Microbacterium sp. A93]|uniref:GrpB family protein n=1 Tax=Microbacterium sp. A93 TaxID=3450716 RepID=UPI003F42D140
MASDECVTLVASEHEAWARKAAEMTVEILEHLPHAKIEHIGSTSVPGLPAKPVVDLAVGMAADEIVLAGHELARLGFDLEENEPTTHGSAIRIAPLGYSSSTSSSFKVRNGTSGCASATSC